MRLTSVVSAAVAAIFVVTALPAQAKPPRDFVGIVAEDVIAGAPGYRAQTLRRQRSLGVQVIRQTFDWTVIEKRKGRWDFRYYDHFVAAAARHGIRVVPVLYNAPRWRAKAPHGSFHYPPRKFKSMTVFGNKVAKRYGNRGTFWRKHRRVPKKAFTRYQIWNEPNLPIYWPRRPNARSYVALLKAARKGIKRADRRAQIVTGGLPDSKYPGSVRLIKYIKQMYKAGGKKAFDQLSINTYARNSKHLVSLLKRVRKTMNRRGDRKAPIWASEFGWSTGGPASTYMAGLGGQAKNIRSSIAAMGAKRRGLKLSGFVLWNWKDAKPYSFDFWGLHAGLLTLTGVPKPSYDAFKNAVRGL
jgi:hypothetical protein